MFHSIIASCLAFGGADTPQLRPDQAVTVGRVIVVGNSTTPSETIFKVAQIAPGDRVTAKTLRRAEAYLTRLGVFEVDPETGVRPTVTVIDPNGAGPRDILIRVKEAPPPK